MKAEKLITFSTLIFILVIIWLLTENVSEFLFGLILALLTGVLVEIFYWRKARKKGGKDLIEILSSIFKKNT
jgi:hypothetical protein